MPLPLNRKSETPLFRQIAEGLKKTIQVGSLKAGHRLPSARELSRELGVNRLTVEGAFDLLERQGLLERRQGSGTYLLPDIDLHQAPAAPSRDWPLWQTQIAAAAEFAVPKVPEPRIHFASGMGDARLIPARDFLRCFQGVLREEGEKALGYEDPQGHPGLRQSIAELLCSQGLPARADNILITTGSQQAISLCAQALLRPGDTILVEEASYDSALALFRQLGLELLPLPMDAGGLCVEALEPLLQKHRPGLLYCMPNFHNPTGCVLSAPRRRLLVELAERYNFPILEDDYVGELRYEGLSLPSLKSLDQRGNVLYTSTFSKMLMPGLRLGYLLAEGPALRHLCLWKQRLEVSSASVLQRALHAYVSVGRYRSHVRRARKVYRERRDALVAALQKHSHKGLSFTQTKGGLFLWLKLPKHMTSQNLETLAATKGLSLAPGSRFFCNPAQGKHFVRLNFAALEIPQIEKGVKILASCLDR